MYEEILVRTPESWIHHMFTRFWCIEAERPQIFTDLKFCCPDGSVSAHKNLLRTCCTTLDQILSRLSECCTSEVVIVAPDYPIHVVKIFLQLFYTGVAKIRGMRDLRQLEEFSQKQLGFQMEMEFTANPPTSIIIKLDPELLSSSDVSAEVRSDLTSHFLRSLSAPHPDRVTTATRTEHFGSSSVDEVERSPPRTDRDRIRTQTSSTKTQTQTNIGVCSTEKPRVCSVCKQTFKDRRELIQHKDKAHIELRAFQCHICLKRFGQRGHMREHILQVHEKVRRFKCDHCGKAFGHRGSFKKHLHVHHGIGLTSKRDEDADIDLPPVKNLFCDYRCLYCEEGFSDLSSLDEHQSSHEKSPSKRLQVFQNVLQD